MKFLRAGHPKLQKGPHAMLQSSPIKHVDYKGGCKRAVKGGNPAVPRDMLTLFKEFRHDVLVMISCFHFFCDMRSGVFQVFCNATQFENYI